MAGAAAELANRTTALHLGWAVGASERCSPDLLLMDQLLDELQQTQPDPARASHRHGPRSHHVGPHERNLTSPC